MGSVLSSSGGGDNSASSAAAKQKEQDDYIQWQRRQQTYQIADPELVKKYAKDPSAVWLDVRSVDEITNPKLGYVHTDKIWIHSECDDVECPILKIASDNLIKNKDAKIIVYCSSGRRAALAKRTLSEQGYTDIINAGGLVDVFYPKKAKK